MTASRPPIGEARKRLEQRLERRKRRHEDPAVRGIWHAVVATIVGQTLLIPVATIIFLEKPAAATVAAVVFSPGISQLLYVVPMVILATRKGEDRYRTGVLGVAGGVLLLTGPLCGWLLLA